MSAFWTKVEWKVFIRHFRKMTKEQAGEDVMKSMDDLEEMNDSGTSFGAKMVRMANERMNSRAAKASVANGSKGGRPRKNSPDTRGGSASPAGCAAGKRIPPQESTTAAGESAEKLDPPNIGGSAASATQVAAARAGGVGAPPKVSAKSPAEGCATGKRIPPPSTAELYDFAEAARLSDADAREWWELCTERDWKDRSGKPIRDWKKACETYCARRAINRMAKGET
ncbi:hypothetical protein SAMN02745108_02825 [Fibrobacter intestinalis]|uniref:Uncharacterized protein n=2 Tax=Fibrobacter intestinalis TaxID=28122 RepID=A0A1T4RS62_9BACT|nr:hypothetical protein SAMN02745108_02825 [Fibrobacter intestinalis]